MFKPKRLIYREASRLENVVTESVPNAIEKVINYGPETIGTAATEIKEVSSGFTKALKGVLKAPTGILSFLGRKVLWQDVAALPKAAALGWYENLKGMTVGTVRHVTQHKWWDAGKTFFGNALGAVTLTPLKAVWNGLKGIVNIPLARLPQSVGVAGTAIKDLTGINRRFEMQNHGIIPGAVSIVKGTVGTALSPLHPVIHRSTVSGWAKKYATGGYELNTTPWAAANQSPSGAANQAPGPGTSHSPAPRPTPPPQTQAANQAPAPAPRAARPARPNPPPADDREPPAAAAA